jgi:hypothetical protein
MALSSDGYRGTYVAVAAFSGQGNPEKAKVPFLNQEVI